MFQNLPTNDSTNLKANSVSLKLLHEENYIFHMFIYLFELLLEFVFDLIITDLGPVNPFSFATALLLLGLLLITIFMDDKHCDGDYGVGDNEF